MRRFGVNTLLVGILIFGLGGAGYLLPFLAPITADSSIIQFETAVLFCWGIGAALVLVGAVVMGLSKAASRP